MPAALSSSSLLISFSLVTNLGRTVHDPSVDFFLQGYEPLFYLEAQAFISTIQAVGGSESNPAMRYTQKQAMTSPISPATNFGRFGIEFESSIDVRGTVGHEPQYQCFRRSCSSSNSISTDTNCQRYTRCGCHTLDDKATVHLKVWRGESPANMSAAKEVPRDASDAFRVGRKATLLQISFIWSRDAGNSR
ncbi:hypothetical protein NA57DRAFT_61933 [Rhizodiscina lignyota]|uniref:Uncharacterized protein n=1 Tax=Rhizodiscina lignyota TaxID=1504668 RepID=A0A9P4I6R0_9PEZI|nr:hypothetical protein NA57DRAFT_61933 [Rhizodiscina lignyota]